MKHISKKIIIIYSAIFILFGASYLFYKSTNNKSSIKTPITISEIKEVDLSQTEEITNSTTSIQRQSNTDQNITLENLPKTDEVYSINTYKDIQKIVTDKNISSIAKGFGFSDEDKTSTLKNDSYRWELPKKTLFFSVSQNQLLFDDQNLPKINSNTPTIEKLDTQAKTFIGELFGKKFSNSLVRNQKTIYYKYEQTKNSTLTIREANSLQEASLIELFYYQNVDNKPVISLSGSDSIIDLIIDKNGVIKRFNLFGGIEESKVSYTFTINLKDILKYKDAILYRMNSTGNLSFDREFGSIKDLNLSTTGIQPGYIQFGTTLKPILLIKGNPIQKEYSQIDATYITDIPIPAP